MTATGDVREHRGPLARRRADRLPRNHRVASIFRLLGIGPISWREQAPGARDLKLANLEAALFAADEPLTARRLAAVAGLKDGNETRRLLRKLQSLYADDRSAFQIEELAGGFQLLTRPEFHSWLARWRRSGHDLRLSSAAKETLAIVAYRQPIPRADVEAVRGVQSGDVLRLLMEKGLVRIVGRQESLGRPVLYGTTRRFLGAFGLRSLNELPEVADLKPPQG